VQPTSGLLRYPSPRGCDLERRVDNEPTPHRSAVSVSLAGGALGGPHQAAGQRRVGAGTVLPGVSATGPAVPARRPASAPQPKLGPHPPDRPALLPIPTLQVAARFGKPSSVSRAARRACQAADYACQPRSPAASSRGVRLMRRMPCWSISRRTVLRWAPSSAVPRPGAHPRTSSRSARYTPRSAKPSWEVRAVSRRSVAWRRWRANRSARGSSLTPTWRSNRLTVHYARPRSSSTRVRPSSVSPRHSGDSPRSNAARSRSASGCSAARRPSRRWSTRSRDSSRAASLMSAPGRHAGKEDRIS
jgi:hypothetical protein